jgi:hypothetical protein
MENQSFAKRRSWGRVAAGLAFLALVIGCGSGKLPPSRLTNRAFVTNSFGGNADPSGVVQIIDVDNNSVSASSISAGTFPALMAISPDRTVTLVLDAENDVSVITNSSESATETVSLTYAAQSLVAVNANTGFAALRDAPAISPQSEVGELAVMDLATGTIPAALGIPRAHYLVLNNSGTKLLVFSDTYSTPCTDGTSALTVIDVATNTPTPVCGFDQAVWGVFSSDDTTAYIMNCGPECGGSRSTAGVQPLNMSLFSTVSTATVEVPANTSVMASAATVGFLNGTLLYVAGTQNAQPGSGKLDVFNVSSGTPVPSATGIPVSDGYHTLMALASNNKLFIGSISCTDTGSAGCLTIFDTSANTAVIAPAQGSGLGLSPPGITGLAPIANENIVYVVENSVLQVYDTTTSALSTSIEIPISGLIVDVKTIDH